MTRMNGTTDNAEKILDDEAVSYRLLMESMEFIASDERDFPGHEYEAVRTDLLTRLAVFLKQWA